MAFQQLFLKTTAVRLSLLALCEALKQTVQSLTQKLFFIITNKHVFKDYIINKTETSCSKIANS